MLNFKNLTVSFSGSGPNRLGTWLLGIAPSIYLRGVQAEVDAERLQQQRGEQPSSLGEVQRTENLRKQESILNIASVAADNLDPDANPENVELDWRASFLARAERISNEDMQAFWGRVLAEEVNKPGTFSLHTVSVIADLSKKDAMKFTSLCGFAMWIADTPTLVQVQNKPEGLGLLPSLTGLHFLDLKDLESLGLISMGSYRLNTQKGNTYLFRYPPDTALRITPRGEKPSLIPFGDVQFTRAGAEICRIVDHPYYQQLVDHCVGVWQEVADIEVIKGQKTAPV